MVAILDFSERWAGNDGGTICHKSPVHKVYIVQLISVQGIKICSSSIEKDI